MGNTIDEIINEAKLFYCVECGKCVGACPMREVYEEFSYKLSPRCITKKALLGFDILDIVKGEEIWFCLGCTVCTEICPAGVRYAQFVESLRLLAISEGVTEHCVFCQRCGSYFVTTPALDNVRGIVEGKGLSNEFLALCPNCRMYDFAERVKK
jgi:heterodisulfide reductase subunit C